MFCIEKGKLIPYFALTVFGIATMSLFIAQLNITSKHNTRIEKQIKDLQNKTMNLNTKLNKIESNIPENTGKDKSYQYILFKLFFIILSLCHGWCLL